MRANENLTVFVELESAIFRYIDLIEKLARFFPSFTPMKTSAIAESPVAFIRRRITSTIPRC
jgi:hypothetical protein